LKTASPIVTWPSEAMTTWPLRRTQMTVVDRMRPAPERVARDRADEFLETGAGMRDMVGSAKYNRRRPGLRYAGLARRTPTVSDRPQ